MRSWMEALDLEPDAIGEPDVIVSLPVRPVGRLRTAEAVPSIEEIVAGSSAAVRIRDEPGLQLHAWSMHPDVVLLVLDREGRVLRHHAAVEAHAGEWVLDGRHGEPAAVMVRDSHGDRVLTVHGGRAAIYRLATLEPLPTPVMVQVPPLGDVVAEDELEAWLWDRLVPLWSSGDPYTRAAAVGLLARYWAPRDPQEALKRLLAGQGGPVERLRDWATRVAPAERKELERIALDEVGSCEAALDEMVQGTRHEQRGLAQLRLVDLVERRDMLESVRWVLAAGPEAPEALDADLGGLDARVEEHWSDRPEPTGLDELPWPRELRGREPDAWWAVS